MGRARPPGRPPAPPSPEPQAKDQYNFTDPESRIMKSSTSQGFEQAYNAQVVVDQASLFILACALSNHPNDKAEAEPALAALPAELGTPEAGAADNGYFSPANSAAFEKRGIAPYIATGREPHHQSWQERFAQALQLPPVDASPIVQVAYKLQTEIGKAIYRLRKCTVEPVIGIIKAVLGFRHNSLRGLEAVAGEWCLVCLAFNLKRLHTLTVA
jgi:Transposase DDE domain